MPHDIYWHNLSLAKSMVLLRVLVINSILLIVFIFLTTPDQFLAQYDKFVDIFELKKSSTALILTTLLPTILLWTFSLTMPLVVAYSDTFAGHWTKTNEHNNAMIKCFL